MIKAMDLSFRYSGSSDWALKDVNLGIGRGECLVLAGPSGCGKSTLAKCLNGLVPHFEKGRRAGRVLLESKDLSEMPMHDIALRIGAVFQNPRSQFFTTDVMDEIAFGCENSGLPRQEIRRRIEKAMARFDVSHLRNRAVFNLSAGERQKAILASVYAMGPDIWVMDEPSSNLEPAAVASLTQIVASLKREGNTIVIAEHRCHYLNGIADRVVLMNEGRVTDEYPGEDFFKFSNEEMNQMGLRWGHVSPGAGPGEDPSPGPATGRRLEATDLRFSYPNRAGDVLDGVSLFGNGGEVVALTGPNGAGKTTLAMMLCGLHKEKSGQVRVNGAPQKAKKRIRHCRLVFQEADHQLFTESAYRELALGRNGHDEAHAPIMDLLTAIGLGAKANQRPQSLSGGEKQRLAVATALVARPEVLILDEPTSGLDAGNMRRMAALLEGAARRGSVVLVVTHDLEFIQTCCTRILRLEKGGIVNG